MVTSITPQGWYFETGDPSVGLFGQGWVHEDCPVPDDHELEDADCVHLATWVNAHGEGTFWYLLTCLDCAEQRIVIDYDYVGLEGDEDEELLYTASQV